MNKEIIITGATGLIGKALSTVLIKQNDKITLFTRNPENAERIVKGAKEYVRWNYKNPEEWKKFLEGKDAIIHIAGANLAARRWDAKYKEVIYNSRIVSTKELVTAIERCKIKPGVFITASAIGIYGNRGDELLTEKSMPGNDFLSKLCYDWEREAEKVERFGVRRVSLRIGLVLSKEGGVLKQLLTPFKLFVGGHLGNGKQWFPWIHIDDLVSVFIHAINNKSVRGPINCTAPGIVTMKEFTKTLGRVLNRPALVPVPRAALKIIIGEITESVLSGQKVSANKLLNSRFNFQFGKLEDALKNLL